MAFKRILKDVIIEEFMEDDEPFIGSVSWRMITWDDEGDGYHAQQYELYKSVMQGEEGGDAESGPRMYLQPGDWELCCQGMGQTRDIEEMIAEYKHYEQCDAKHASEHMAQKQSADWFEQEKCMSCGADNPTVFGYCNDCMPK